MQLLRKILFYLFALLYIIFCPILLMHAFGYIFRLNIEKGVVNTGLISFATVPPHAALFLENRRFTSATPAVIRDLIPGKYRVQLALKGYLPWSETIFVEAGKATIRDKVILVPGAWRPQVLLAGKYLSLTPIEETNYLLLAQGQLLKDWVVYEVKKNLSWPLVEHSSPWSFSIVTSVYKVKRSNYVLIQISANSKTRYLWVGLREKENKIQDVTHLITTPADQAQWDPDEPETIFILQGAALQKINLATGTLDPDYSQKVKGYCVRGREVFVLEDNGMMFRMDYDKKLREPVPLDPALRSMLSKDSGKGEFNIQSPVKGVFFLQGRQGEIWINLPTYELVRQDARGYAFSSDAQHALFWKQDQIGILDLSFTHHAYIRGMNRWGSGVSWEFQHGLGIRRAFFVYGDSHILFLDKDTLYLLAVAGDTPQAARRLFDVRENSDIYYWEYRGRVYYLDCASGNLACVEIVP